MYLQKLEINGFKSFARKTTLEFSQGTTAVVGPNGSGKSNVAESIRWVMGEQSIKSLRGKRSSDVIFSGSDKASRLGLAEVSLYFDNSDQRAPIDFSEIVITRRISRDGQGEYLINNQSARLQDILMLLAQINLSSKTYSVISQGMVDAILTITPHERREFFEEASGVKPLQIKRNESWRKILATQDNIETIEIQLNEIEPRLRSLTRQVKRLEERSEVESKLFDLQYHYFGETLATLKKEQQQETGKEEELSKKISLLEEGVQKLQDQMRSLTQDTVHSGTFDALQKTYQETFKKKSTLKEQELHIKAQLMQSVKQSQKTNAPMHVVKEVYEKWQQHITVLKKLNYNLKDIKDLNQLNEWKDHFDAIVEQLGSTFDQLQSYFHKDVDSGLEKKIKSIAIQIKELDDQQNATQEQISKLSETQKEEKAKIWETQNELQSSQRELNALTNQRNDHLVARARTETRIADIENEVIDEMGQEFLKKLVHWKPPSDAHGAREVSLVREQIHQLKRRLEMIGGIDPEIRKEYIETKERHEFLSLQLSDLYQSMENLRSVIEDLDETIRKQFKESFDRINDEFQKYFKMLFRGGRSELSVLREPKKETSEEGEEEEIERKTTFRLKRKKENDISGVEISATPPGKKLKSIHMLSGGERALTAIALICAIIANNPAPFVVLDEVDAALDEANSMRFAEILKELSTKTQFIVITHNRATMEQANLLYGITMGDDGISKLLSLKLESAEQFTNR